VDRHELTLASARQQIEVGIRTLNAHRAASREGTPN
jgi:hypothetical protein